MTEWGLEHPNNIIKLSPGYLRLALSKSEQVTKIIGRDVTGYCHIKAALVFSILFHYQLTIFDSIIIRQNLTKTYLAFVVKS